MRCYLPCIQIRSSDKIDDLRRRASFSIPKAYQRESEEDMTVGRLSRVLSEVHHSVASEVDPFVSLNRHSSSTQVKDNTLPEAITIREIFKAPCLQSLGNLESLVNTFSSESHEEVNELLYSLSDDSLKKVSRSHHVPGKRSFTLKSTSTLRALSTASDLMQKLSLRQKSPVFCPQIHDDKVDMDKSQVVTSEDEQVHTQVKYADSSLKEDIRKSEVPLQAAILKSKLEVNPPEPVSITAQSKFSQIDPLENGIEHLWRELVVLRSQVSFPPNYIPGIAFFITSFFKKLLL